jgi:hypothetical protein
VEVDGKRGKRGRKRKIVEEVEPQETIVSMQQNARKRGRKRNIAKEVKPQETIVSMQQNASKRGRRKPQSNPDDPNAGALGRNADNPSEAASGSNSENPKAAEPNNKEVFGYMKKNIICCSQMSFVNVY